MTGYTGTPIQFTNGNVGLGKLPVRLETPRRPPSESLAARIYYVQYSHGSQQGLHA